MSNKAIGDHIVGKGNLIYKCELKKELIELSKTMGLKILSECLMVAAKSLSQASYNIEKIISEQNTKH